MLTQDPSVAERRRRLATFAMLWLFVAAVLVTFRGVVLPFAGSALIAYLMAPWVDRLSQRSIRGHLIPRWAAVLLLYAVFFAMVYLATVALVPPLYRELARIARDALDEVNALTPERIRELAARTEAWVSARGLPIEMGEAAPGVPPPSSGLSFSFNLEALIQGLASRASQWARDHLRDIVSLSTRVVGGALTSVFMLFFMLMVAAFFSIDIRNIRAYVKGLVPREYSEEAAVLVGRIDRSLAGVVRGQVTICLVNGGLTLVGLLLFKVPFAYLLAVVATVLSLIPIFGAIISSVPICLIGLAQKWQTGLAMLLWVIGIHALEAYLLNPKIMGSAARIHPVIVAFALIAGERSFGLVGALFAVPIAAVVVACFDFARQKGQGITTV